jgi:hypothetical protein
MRQYIGFRRSVAEGGCMMAEEATPLIEALLAIIAALADHGHPATSRATG